MEFRHQLISCLLTCWACDYNFFNPKSPFGLGHAVAQCLRTNAVDAIRFDGRNEIELRRG